MTCQFAARPLTLFSNTLVLPNFIASCNFVCGPNVINPQI